MKTKTLKKLVASVVAVGLVLTASNALSQNVTAANPAQLPYGVPQIVQLAQANVADNTIIAYVKNSGASYGLDANLILYLHRQGVSDAVITAMLNQPGPAAATASQPAAAAQPVVATTAPPAPVPVATVAPSVTYVQTAPPPVYYYQPYYQPYYYPAFGVSPALSLSFAWGGGGSSGRYYGGWHGGGWHR